MEKFIDEVKAFFALADFETLINKIIEFVKAVITGEDPDLGDYID